MRDNPPSFCIHEYPVIAQRIHPPEASSIETPLHFDHLTGHLRDQFERLPDSRKGNNRQTYTMTDAGLSAFSVFFMQSPSFLDYQSRMQKQRGVNNAQSLFGVHQIPSSNQIRNLLDPVDPTYLYPLLVHTGQQLWDNGYLESYRVLDDQLLVALDGTDTFSSEKIHCPCCREQTLKNGKTLYRHTAVTPVIVAPGESKVIPLPPEFVQPQDGEEKQDCEIAAGKRWLSQWSDTYSPWGITLLGDDLYCHQPFCQAALNKGFNFLLVCKPDSHALIYEWVADFERNKQLQVFRRQYREKGKRLTAHYRYLNDLPLRDSQDALTVSWCEVTITNAKGTVLYHNAWATSHRIHQHNVADIVAAGRTRWKVENENNNVLKNQGYQLDHNFGHGKQNLSNLLVTMALLAFLMHTALEWIDQRYRQLRQQPFSRKAFFEHIRTLVLFLPFENWNHLMEFMLNPDDYTPNKMPGGSN